MLSPKYVRKYQCEEEISDMDGKTGKLKINKQARKKNKLVDHHHDPFHKLISNPYHYGTYFHNTCITKLWKTTPRLCSPTLLRPWLVLLHHPHPDHILRAEWSRYWWSIHHNTWRSPCSCCPRGTTRQGPELTWTKEESKLLDSNSPHQNDPLQFTNAIMLRDKVYVLSLHGTLATLDLASQPRLRVLNVRTPLPSTITRGFRECLLEYCGQLMLVFLIFTNSTNIVGNVEVYRLQNDNSWTRMASLGDIALFATHTHCGGVSPSKLAGCTRNSVYFKQVKEGGWWVFNMEDGRISPICPKGLNTLANN